MLKVMYRPGEKPRGSRPRLYAVTGSAGFLNDSSGTATNSWGSIPKVVRSGLVESSPRGWVNRMSDRSGSNLRE